MKSSDKKPFFKFSFGFLRDQLKIIQISKRGKEGKFEYLNSNSSSKLI